MAIEQVLLIGVQGGFGRLLARRLTELGLRVSGVARRPRDAGLEMLDAYHQADALTMDEPYRKLIQQADCIVLCLPDEPTQQAVPLVAAEMTPGALLTDVLSVKTHVARVMAHERDDIELVSLHPMFAPSVDFANQNVVVVPVRPGPKSDEVRGWLDAWQSNVTVMSADDHDRTASLTQTATHTAVLAFGLALLNSAYDPQQAESTSTPAHRSLLSQLARIVGSDPEVYWKILHDNPNSRAVLDRVAAAVDQLRTLATDGNQDQLGELFASIRNMLGDDQAALFERSNKMFQLDADAMKERVEE